MISSFFNSNSLDIQTKIQVTFKSPNKKLKRKATYPSLAGGDLQVAAG
jgi:hypothetical protein